MKHFYQAIIIIICSLPLYAMDSLSVIDSMAEFYVDESTLLPFQDISSSDRDSLFSGHKGRGFNFSLSNDVVWIKFMIGRDRRDIPDPGLYINCPYLQYLDLYIPVSSDREEYRLLEGGSLRRPGNDQVGFKNSLFFFPDDWDPSRPAYLRLQTESSRAFSIYWGSRSMLDRMIWKELIFWGAVGGVLLAMFLYNLFLAVSLKNRTNFLYVLYIGTFILYYLLQQNFLWFAGRTISIGIIILTINVAYCFAASFSRSFLLTKEKTAVLDKLIMAIPFWALLNVVILLGNVLLSNKMTYALSLYSTMVFMSAGIIRYRQNFFPARYYSLAWIILNLCVLFYALRGIGLYPEASLIRYLPFIGTTAESILLSLALAGRVKFLTEENQVLTYMSLMDELTGVYNKRHFTKALSKYAGTSFGASENMGMIMLDVDYFKDYNDSYGHPKGDEVLSRLGTILKDSLREKDIPCRYGGEEFSIILRRTNEKELYEIAERIRIRFGREVFQPRKDLSVSVTLSCGATMKQKGEAPEDLLRRADSALYEAKDLGRNRTVLR